MAVSCHCPAEATRHWSASTEESLMYPPVILFLEEPSKVSNSWDPQLLTVPHLTSNVFSFNPSTSNVPVSFSKTVIISVLCGFGCLIIAACVKLMNLPAQLWNSALFSVPASQWQSRQMRVHTATSSKTPGRVAGQSTFPWPRWQFPPALNAHSGLLASYVPGYQLLLQACNKKTIYCKYNLVQIS